MVGHFAEFTPSRPRPFPFRISSCISGSRRDLAFSDTAVANTIRPHRLEFPTNIPGGPLMDDSASQQFFTQPAQTYHRRYEALRAVFVDGRSQKEVAQQFGYTYGTMRQLVFEFRQVCNDPQQATDAFFFETLSANRA
jgi:hypothetical protein